MVCAGLSHPANPVVMAWLALLNSDCSYTTVVSVVLFGVLTISRWGNISVSSYPQSLSNIPKYAQWASLIDELQCQYFM